MLEDEKAVLGVWRVRANPATASVSGYLELLRAAADLDIRFLDHADIYDDGAVEALHGEARRRDRGLVDRFRLITKAGVRFPSAGQPGVSIAHYRSDLGYLTGAVEASLKRLGTDCIDLFLIHRPDYLMDCDETGEALDGMMQAGKIAAAGTSNFPRWLDEALGYSMQRDLSAMQHEFSLFRTDPLDSGELQLAKEDERIYLAWSPLGGGQLFNAGDATAARIRQWQERHRPDSDLAGLALQWLVRHPAPVKPVLGTTKIDRLRMQLAAITAPPMDVQEWYGLLEAARGTRVP
jgi:predicted oxidoreductase